MNPLGKIIQTKPDNVASRLHATIATISAAYHLVNAISGLTFKTCYFTVNFDLQLLRIIAQGKCNIFSFYKKKGISSKFIREYKI